MTTTDPTPVKRWVIPHPQSLTLADLDEVFNLTGIDIQDPANARPGRIIAALVVWQSHRDGNPTTLEEVYRTVNMGEVHMSTVDPTGPAPA